MLAPPEWVSIVSRDMGSPLVQPQMIGVVPHPPCSKPGLGTTFAAVAWAGDANPNASAAVTIKRVLSRVTGGTSSRRPFLLERGGASVTALFFLSC
jgi:hypothetical protein